MYKNALATVCGLSTFLSACSVISGEASDNWAYATSAAVLGLAPAKLEKRLGKPEFASMPGGSPATDLAYKIGECSVIFNVKENKVWRVHIPLDQPCKPSFDGVQTLQNADLGRKPKYSDIPADIVGIWLANCMLGSRCDEAGATMVTFYSAGKRERGGVDISFETQLVTKDEIAARRAWAVALVGRHDVYSEKATELTVCGTANQQQATALLKGLRINAVNFGRGLDELIPQGCPPRSSPVSIASSQGGLSSSSPPKSGSQRVDVGQVAGAWVPREEMCESDAGILFHKDGSWGTINESGRWSVEGDRLTMTTLERGEQEGDEWKKLTHPEKSTVTIARLTDKEMVQHDSRSAQDLVFKRCG